MNHIETMYSFLHRGTGIFLSQKYIFKLLIHNLITFKHFKVFIEKFKAYILCASKGLSF